MCRQKLVVNRWTLLRYFGNKMDEVHASKVHGHCTENHKISNPSVEMLPENAEESVENVFTFSSDLMTATPADPPSKRKMCERCG